MLCGWLGGVCQCVVVGCNGASGNGCVMAVVVVVVVVLLLVVVMVVVVMAAVAKRK